MAKHHAHYRLSTGSLATDYARSKWVIRHGLDTYSTCQCSDSKNGFVTPSTVVWPLLQSPFSHGPRTKEMIPAGKTAQEWKLRPLAASLPVLSRRWIGNRSRTRDYHYPTSPGLVAHRRLRL